MRKLGISDLRRMKQKAFEYWEKRLGGQLKFTWDDLLKDVEDFRAASTAASSSRKTGTEDMGSYTGLLSFPSGHS
jgi:hypothetical protein